MAWFFRDTCNPLTKAQAEKAMDGDRCPDCGSTRHITADLHGTAFACHSGAGKDDHCGCQWSPGDLFEVRRDRR